MRKNRKILAAAASALAAALVVVAVASGAAQSRSVQVLDDCEAASFNAAIGPGTCVKDGGVTFSEFIDQLVTQGRAPAWRFSPEQLQLSAGGTLNAHNRGGEFHTLTEVAAFGGGCVPELNEILGLTPVPECATPGIFGTTGIAPGGTLETAPLAAGTHRFMCLIHPWMKTTATVG
jgi:plastocyanin